MSTAVKEQVKESPPLRRVPPWKIPSCDSAIINSLREVLGVPEGGELPEEVYLVLAIRSALDQGFVEGNFGRGDIANIIIQASLMPLVETASNIKSGTEVRVNDLPDRVIYVCPGPLGMDLVNMGGRFFLRSPKDITIEKE